MEELGPLRRMEAARQSRVQETANLTFLNKKDRDKGFTKMRAGTFIAVAGIGATLLGGGVIGIPACILAGKLISDGVEQGIIVPSVRVDQFKN